MAQWVTVWRAAQLVGVPRGVLQQRVRSGEIELADGLVSTEALIKLYPQTQLESSGMFKREMVQNERDKVTMRLRKGYDTDSHFLALWEKIRARTRYRVQYKTSELIANAASTVQPMSSPP